MMMMKIKMGKTVDDVKRGKSEVESSKKQFPWAVPAQRFSSSFFFVFFSSLSLSLFLSFSFFFFLGLYFSFFFSFIFQKAKI
jgi:hypothetical protein